MCASAHACVPSEAGMARIPNQEGLDPSWAPHIRSTCDLPVRVKSQRLPLDEKEHLRRKCHRKHARVNEKPKNQEAGAGGGACTEPTHRFLG